MNALAGIWLGFFLFGSFLIAFDFEEAIRAGLFGHVDGAAAAVAAAAAGAAGGAAAAAGAGSGTGTGDKGAFPHLPVLGLLGIFLAQSSWKKYSALGEGNTVAMTGDCPNCAEKVYAFLDANRPEVRHTTECHVCGRWGLVDVSRHVIIHIL
jgi:hypothetical protein